MKNEIGNRYGDYMIIAEHREREPSNGCIKWIGECLTCGSKRIFNGNNLRFGVITGVCSKCKRFARRKR